MSLAMFSVVMYRSSEPYFFSQSAAYVLARSTLCCSSAAEAGM